LDPEGALLLTYSPMLRLCINIHQHARPIGCSVMHRGVGEGSMSSFKSIT